MDELLVRASHWKHDEDGKRPYKSPTLSTPDFLKKKREDEEMQKRVRQDLYGTRLLLAVAVQQQGTDRSGDHHPKP